MAIHALPCEKQEDSFEVTRPMFPFWMFSERLRPCSRAVCANRVSGLHHHADIITLTPFNAAGQEPRSLKAAASHQLLLGNIVSERLCLCDDADGSLILQNIALQDVWRTQGKPTAREKKSAPLPLDVMKSCYLHLAPTGSGSARRQRRSRHLGNGCLGPL